MRTLKEIIEDVNQCEMDMTIDPGEADYRVRAGVEAQIRNASSKLPSLKNEYREAIAGHVLLIGVHGKGAKEFANIAKYSFKTATADVNYSTTRIKDSFRERGARREFQSQEMFMLYDELNKMKVEFNILSLPQPNANFGSVQMFGQDTDMVIDQIIHHNYGKQLHIIGARNQIYEAAYKSKFHGTLLPVVLFNEFNDDFSSDDESVLPFVHSIFEAPEEVDDAFVDKVLADVRNSLKATVAGSDENEVQKTNKIETKTKTKETNTKAKKPSKKHT